MFTPIDGTRKRYNSLVANENLEDYALRYTARKARRYSSAGVITAATGSISFLALEGIGASVAISCGMNHLTLALLIAAALIMLLSFPIARCAVRYHVDIDLLTRGAGFGYLGSSVTSLIYASFTFIFLAFEAAILAGLLRITAGVPLWLGYTICAFIVIPLILNGFSFISRFQCITEPLWAALQILAIYGTWKLFKRGEFYIEPLVSKDAFSPLLLGMSLSVLLALISQIGEQCDYLRFMPDPKGKNGRNSLPALIGCVFSGPGWIILGGLKIFLGAVLGLALLQSRADAQTSSDPNWMYRLAFSGVFSSEGMVLTVTALFVVISQIKINITNGYAGSIAWSNFFSRLTHSHPGRVVWVFFNVIVAWLLMNSGILQMSSAVLRFYSVLAISWCGTIAADIIINKRLGLSPRHIEFKRAYLYDLNPVGLGSMLIALSGGYACYFGLFGDLAAAWAPLASLALAFTCCPLIAWATHGRYYLARRGQVKDQQAKCIICGHEYEAEDLVWCPVYGGYICSLCCTLDSCCGDACKPGAGIRSQTQGFLPAFTGTRSFSVAMHFVGYLALFSIITCSIVLTACGILQTRISGFYSYAPLNIILIFCAIATCIFAVLFTLMAENRLRTQTEFLKQNEMLKREIRKRGRIEAELSEARAKADAANLAKSRYLSGISHELRTPLNTIMGYSEILDKAQDIPERHHHALDIICRSSGYLADLIEGLLDISKIEAGRIELHPGKLRINELLDELSSYFGAECRKRGLAFEYKRLNPLPQFVKADVKRFRQILTNLLSNAVKYTPSGKVSLEVSYRNEVAVFKVSDTGIGIPKEDLSRIFEPFTRLAEAKQRNTGSGLGLTITMLLAQIMGGDLGVTSELGKGSVFTFKVLLPRITPAVSDLTEPSPVVGYRGSDTRRYRVLVVDDNEFHRELMASVLEPVGFEVLQAPGADEALAVSAAEHPDLYFLDISMPVHDGWYLLKELRSRGIHDPIVMLSAEASEGKVPDDLKKLHNGYIIKPFRQSALFDTINRVLPVDFITRSDEAGTKTPDQSAGSDVTEEKHPEGKTAPLPQAPCEKPDSECPGLKDAIDSRSRETLLEYAGLGYVKGLESTVEALESEGSISDRCAGCLLDLIRSMRFSELTRLLN